MFFEWFWFRFSGVLVGFCVVFLSVFELFLSVFLSVFLSGFGVECFVVFLSVF